MFVQRVSFSFLAETFIAEQFLNLQFSKKFWIEVVVQKNTEQKILMSTEQQNGGKNI